MNVPYQNIVYSTIQTAVTDQTTTDWLAAPGSGFQYGVLNLGFTNGHASAHAIARLLNSLGATHSTLGNLWEIGCPANMGGDAITFEYPGIPCGENQPVKFKSSANASITGAIRAVKIKI